MKERIQQILDKFENLYGYQVSEELFNWIFLSELYQGKKEFTVILNRTSINLSLIPSLQFRIDEKSIIQPSDISYIFSTCPHIIIGSNYSGHTYFVSTIKEKRKTVYYIDEECPSIVQKHSTTASKIIKGTLNEDEKIRLRDVKKYFSNRIAKEKSDLEEFFFAPKLEKSNKFSSGTQKDREEGRFAYELFGLRKLLSGGRSIKTSIKPLLEHDTLVAYLEDEEFDYYSSASAIGRINCEIVKLSLMYYFANEMELLEDLLKYAKQHIKGNIFKTFVTKFSDNLKTGENFYFLDLKNKLDIAIIKD